MEVTAAMGFASADATSAEVTGGAVPVGFGPKRRSENEALLSWSQIEPARTTAPRYRCASVGQISPHASRHLGAGRHTPPSPPLSPPPPSQIPPAHG